MIFYRLAEYAQHPLLFARAGNLTPLLFDIATIVWAIMKPERCTQGVRQRAISALSEL